MQINIVSISYFHTSSPLLKELSKIFIIDIHKNDTRTKGAPHILESQYIPHALIVGSIP